MLAHTAFKIVVDRLRRIRHARAMRRSRESECHLESEDYFKSDRVLVWVLYDNHEGRRRCKLVWIDGPDQSNAEVWLKKKGTTPKRIA